MPGYATNMNVRTARPWLIGSTMLKALNGVRFYNLAEIGGKMKKLLMK